MLDQPKPIPMSTTRAGGSASSRAWRSGIDGQPGLAKEREVHRSVRVGLASAHVVAGRLEGEAADPVRNDSMSRGRAVSAPITATTWGVA